MQTNIRISGLADEAAADIENQINAHLKLGWNEIELRTIEGQTLCQLPSSDILAISNRLKENALTCTAIGSPLGNWATPITSDFSNEIEKAKVLFEHMHILGSKYVRIMSYPNDGLDERAWRDESIRRIEILSHMAASEQIVLLHENCAGWAGKNHENTLQLLAAVNSPSLKLLFDIGNGIAYNYSSLAFLQHVIDHVEHVHIKDGFKQNNDVAYCLPGQGHSNVKACLEFLKQRDYSGIFSIEPHLQFIPHLQQQGDEQVLSNSYVKYGLATMDLLKEIYG